LKTARWHAFATVFGIVSLSESRRALCGRIVNAGPRYGRMRRFRRDGLQPRFVVETVETRTPAIETGRRRSVLVSVSKSLRRAPG
jgi:hypothetical protein